MVMTTDVEHHRKEKLTENTVIAFEHNGHTGIQSVTETGEETRHPKHERSFLAAKRSRVRSARIRRDPVTIAAFQRPK